MRYFYSCLFYIIFPFILLKLLYRSIREPAYRLRIKERLGFSKRFQSCIWVHAVSVGESLAAIPLIKKLQCLDQETPILVTTMTPTGAERLKSVFGERITHQYLPYDLPTFVSRFLERVKPKVGIIMETELWPNLLELSKRKNISMCLLNARLSEKSAAGYQKILPLTRSMLNNLTFIAAHGSKDKARFIQLGAPKEKVYCTGNLKFDLVLPSDLKIKGESMREKFGESRFVWIAASTHEGEEEIILKAHQLLRRTVKNALLLLVPRHPNRFDVVYKRSKEQLPTVRRSLNTSVDAETAVYLCDTMGEMLLLFSASDVAFVGGSLIERGGHNILEPGALGLPVLSGPSLYNFAEIKTLFEREEALQIVRDAKTLSETLLTLWREPEKREIFGARALNVVNQNRGALAKQIELIQKYFKL